MRTVALKITAGGGLVAVAPDATGDLVVRVTGVPVSASLDDVVAALARVTLMPMRGPWAVSWERIADADPGSILTV